MDILFAEMKFHFSRELKKPVNYTLQAYLIGDSFIHNKILILEEPKLYSKSTGQVSHFLCG